MNQSPAPPTKSSTITAIAAISVTAETPLVTPSNENSATTALEMTSRIRATLERRMTRTASTMAMIAHTTRPRMTATSTPTAASASMLASWNSGTRSISVITWSRAMNRPSAVNPNSAAVMAEKTMVIQAAAVTVPGRRSPAGCWP